MSKAKFMTEMVQSEMDHGGPTIESPYFLAGLLADEKQLDEGVATNGRSAREVGRRIRENLGPGREGEAGERCERVVIRPFGCRPQGWLLSCV